MVEPLRHRQTEGAATDMLYLMPPRHISTLHRKGHSAGSTSEVACRPILTRRSGKRAAPDQWLSHVDTDDTLFNTTALRITRPRRLFRFATPPTSGVRRGNYA